MTDAQKLSRAEHMDLMRENENLKRVLGKANAAINAAFAQADAEFRGHDRIADRHDAVVREFRNEVHATLSNAGFDAAVVKEGMQ